MGGGGGSGEDTTKAKGKDESWWNIPTLCRLLARALTALTLAYPLLRQTPDIPALLFLVTLLSSSLTSTLLLRRRSSPSQMARRFRTQRQRRFTHPAKPRPLGPPDRSRRRFKNHHIRLMAASANIPGVPPNGSRDGAGVPLPRFCCRQHPRKCISADSASPDIDGSTGGGE